MEGNFLEAPVEEDKEPRSVNISSDYLQAIYQRLSLATVLIPFVGTVLAVGLLPFAPIGLSEVVLFFVSYLSTMLGVEVGYHRYFAHRSFRTVKLIEAFLILCKTHKIKKQNFNHGIVPCLIVFSTPWAQA